MDPTTKQPVKITGRRRVQGDESDRIIYNRVRALQRVARMVAEIVSRKCRVVCAVAAMCEVALVALAPCHADPPPVKDLAADAYDRGVQAHAHRRYAEAAREFARADAIQPDDTALRAALDAALLADEPLLGMELLQRAQGRVTGGEVAAIASRVRDAFSSRVAWVTLSCERAVDCQVQLDGSPVGVGRAVLVVPGRHLLERVGTQQQRTVVTLAGGESRSIVMPDPLQPKPERPAPVTPTPATGLSPWWFYSSAALTVVLGGLTIGSGIDTVHKHDQYETRGCGQAFVGGCGGIIDNGIAAQNRTNWLIAGTALAGATTVVVGSFLVRWSAPLPSHSGNVGSGWSIALQGAL